MKRNMCYRVINTSQFQKYFLFLVKHRCCICRIHTLEHLYGSFIYTNTIKLCVCLHCPHTVEFNIHTFYHIPPSLLHLSFTQLSIV